MVWLNNIWFGYLKTNMQCFIII